MEKSQVEHILDKLRNKEIEEYFVEKESFLSFREVLVNQEDFKHFRGIAGHGGVVVYTYVDEARS
ncbi:abortive phage infection protein [Bacillus suaedaesalsae]|uniref:Abortive phage infection protein n=1 Tax=Bacillus suaedaesalsae TaxID=2810349 RepID=A0ABS2DGJ7_9BACI|nr:abortive phage infection protein [Bacillus suaedaesalsae]MBM6617583.1 abortive phage infection protein [Bacillus suaedaesalsae]